MVLTSAGEDTGCNIYGSSYLIPQPHSDGTIEGRN